MKSLVSTSWVGTIVLKPGCRERSRAERGRAAEATPGQGPEDSRPVLLRWQTCSGAHQSGRLILEKRSRIESPTLYAKGNFRWVK